MRRIIFGFVVVLAFLMIVAAPSQAQGPTATPSPDCKPADLIGKLATLKATGDAAKDMVALLAVQDQIAAQNIACNGFSFTGTGSKLIGPFNIEAGQYRVSFLTWDYMSSIKIKSLGSKQCVDSSSEDLISMSVNGENLMGPSVQAPHEALLDTATCRMTLVLDIMNSGKTKPWTLTIEPLK